MQQISLIGQSTDFDWQVGAMVYYLQKTPNKIRKFRLTFLVTSVTATFFFIDMAEFLLMVSDIAEGRN